ncbi:MAG: anhydro-N-acetylmuramic acid kinase [Colwellia sp.]
MKKYYIGLMSGTSADGIDLALVSFDEQINANQSKPRLIASYYQQYEEDETHKITSLYNPSNHEIDRAFELDIELAQLFSDAINALLIQEGISPDEIIAIGSHGQTIRHRPTSAFPFTLQIGCNQTLATLTNIKVIGQFRRKDMALGGQGAPLVPAFHQKIFTEENTDVFVVNIGGIANISYLPKNSSLRSSTILGFDTGPGNALMDDWYQLNHQNSEYRYDKNGAWAKTGKVNKSLLNQLLTDKYFTLLPPKSTGREYFNSNWLQTQLRVFTQQNSADITNQDIQATLTSLTAITISNTINQLSSQAIIYLCGGGAHNKQLFNELNKYLQQGANNNKLLLTDQKGIDGDQLEAIAFAWLAFAYDKKLLSNIPAVTGARESCTLGTAFYP